MWIFIFKTLVAALLIAFVSWLSGKKIGMAGFLTALPLTSMLALAFSQLEWGKTEQTYEYAKSVFFAVPLSLLFFVPFLIAPKFHLNFWIAFLAGIGLLGVGYFVHSHFST